MRNSSRKATSRMRDTCATLLTWGDGGEEHKIGYGTRSSFTASDRDEVAFRGAGPIPSSFLQARLNDAGPFHQDAAKAVRIAALRLDMARQERARSGALDHLSLNMDDVHAICRAPVSPAACCTRLSRQPTATGRRRSVSVRADGCSAACAPAPTVLVAARRALTDFGAPYGHGLAQLGLDAGRLLLVEPAPTRMRCGHSRRRCGRRHDRRWLPAWCRRPRSHHQPPAEPRRRRACHTARPAAHPDCHRHQRRRHALAHRLRTGRADRFGAFAHPRWSVALERCRNGRTGKWLIEWDHVAHRFRLVEGVADRAPVAAHRPPPRRLKPVDRPPAAGARCVRPRAARASSRSTGPRSAPAWPQGELLSNARSKVLDLQTRDADPDRRCRRLAPAGAVVPALYARRGAWDEASGADGLFLDITGCAHLFGGEERAAGRS